MIGTTFGLCLLVAFGTMGLGAVRVPQPHAIEALFGHGTPDQIRIIRDFELPRILIALLVGSSLAIAGAVIQGVIRNPLAAPDIIGVTKGAGLGAVILLLAYPTTAVSYLPAAAFVGGVTAMVIVYAVSYSGGGTTVVRLALVGIAVSALCEAMIRYVMIDRQQGIGTALVSGSPAHSPASTCRPSTSSSCGSQFSCRRSFMHKLDVLSVLGDDLAEGSVLLPSSAPAESPCSSRCCSQAPRWRSQERSRSSG